MLDSSLSGIVTTLLLVFLFGVITAKPAFMPCKKAYGLLIIAARLKVVINKRTHNILSINLLIMRHINSVYRIARSLKMQLTNLL